MVENKNDGPVLQSDNPTSDNQGAVQLIVESLYSVVLGRSADPSGLQTHAQDIENNGLSRFPALLGQFLRSPESMKRNASFFRRGDVIVAPNAESFKYIISLGDLCLPATIIKKMGLKNQSFPFDWIFSNPKMIVDCLEDNFAKFIDRQHLAPVSDNVDDRRCHHILYEREFGIGNCVFNHKNPLRKDDYEYYRRAILRFNKALQNPGKKLFLLFRQDKEVDVLKEFHQIVNSLSSVTENFKVLFIKNEIKVGEFGTSISTIEENDMGFLLHFVSSSPLINGTKFKKRIDNLMLEGVIDSFPLNLESI